MAVVLFAWKQHHALMLDRMATGMGGAFATLLGIMCLVGQRVMSHMHDALVVERTAGIQRVRERIEL